MGEKNLKLIFSVLAIVMLSAMLLISRDAGISGDEEVHYKHSEMVYNYFSTLGNDKSSLHTPKTHLQYYGQASDNLVTMLIHGFGIEDIYGFRHFMSSFFGWLAILVTALFAAWLAGYGAAIWVLILFALSPTFLGHAQNNLKDIPFALAYISSIYYSLKLVFSETKPTRQTILLLILSIAFSIGIRIGGVLVVFYLGFFMFMKTVLDWISNKKLNPELLKKQLILFVGISLAGYLLGLIIWPYALQNPWLNPWKSFQVMTHFPTTVRQIFEGRFDWSDFHPWYYLPKYMAITIPFIVFSGIVAFFLNIRKNYSSDQKLKLFMLGFTILFPIIFVILKKSNLYGSWRHFLFVYPGIILISALGIHAFLVRFKHRIIRIAAILLLLVLSVHPLRFMAANHPYYYLYYNQFTGGLKGAYGNYETDYYYHSMRGGAEWLQEYLKNKPNGSEIIVGGNFPIKWYFRKDKTVKFVYFPYQRRSEYNWDYAIIANSYISSYELKNKNWPPVNTIHTIFADGIPVCAIIERVSKDDLLGIQELDKGHNIKSALLFQNALDYDPQNELIYSKFAESLIESGQNEQAEQILQKCLKINPEYEPALILSGDLALKQKDTKKAAGFYEKVIQTNRKYFSVYPKLAGIYEETDVGKARKVLKKCLKLNSQYIPALVKLAETYRETAPEIAAKYDEQINKLKQ
ncbi:MAG TPA: tetratricopeptide repeat protein [Prolixibacteraceae bacterium]|nr:tetratricopeptide repeat protein [Prolixibacteraceae bacterium]